MKNECFEKPKIEDIIIKYINEKDEYDDEPFYIVNLKKVEEQYVKWINYLPDIQPYFAIKSNPDNKIINLLAKLGCNFDCASKNELINVLSIVINPDRIIFANPCKISSHLIYAYENKINKMTFDCIEELEKIYNIFPNAQLILRICVDDSNSKCKFNSKFGCPLCNIPIIFDRIKSLQMNLLGFSFHVGSGCSDAKSFYNAIKDCYDAYNIAKKYGFNINIIDIGGGFPGVDKNIIFADICYNINKAIDDFFSYEKNNNIIKFIAEPGRFFTESTHTLVINVIAKKKEENVIKYYLNDGIYGSFNCINYDHQTPDLIPLKTTYNATNKYNTTFFGPTCDSLDCIYKDIQYQELNIGDWLYVTNFGSYTVSPSSTFNGFSVNNKKYIS
jgi:ornithine decarboxylase